jgi:DNA-directed RNA polymerase subunit RPC12/RpoP
MPHSINEGQLENICAQCKKPHGDKIVLKNNHHKIYEVITCQNCNYEIIRIKVEKPFEDRWEMVHRI